jgi:hypothetical protein
MNLEVIPVPRRFVSRHDVRSRLTTVRFGAGDASTLDDDIIPDPSELSLPLYGKSTFHRFSIDPNSLLKTHTLGISPMGTTITITYRYGGGLSHNVPAEIRPNPYNPLSTQLFVISRDSSGNLAVSPDALKENLVSYINEFRLISDSIDILDAQVVNFGIRFSVLTLPTTNKQKVVHKIVQRLTKIMNIKYFQIDQPIIRDDVTNVIINTPGVISLLDLSIFSIVGKITDRQYSSNGFDFTLATKRGMIVGPAGTIFELKFPAHDILGSAA